MWKVNHMIFEIDKRIVAAISPLDIATEGAGVDGEVAKEFADMFQLGNLYFVLRRDLLIWTTIVVVGLLISMQFVKKSEKLAERKNDILHKLLIALIGSTIIWLFSLVVAVLEYIF